MSKLKIAVVGVGSWGRNHVRVLSELPDVEVVAVCDIDKQKTDLVAEKYGIEAFTSSSRMYRKKKLDAVNLCVWSTHLSQEAMKALKAGKHVFVEKPMASSTREAKKIINLAREKKLCLTVGFIERFNPAVRRLKQAIINGDVGSPVSATVRRVSKWPERIGDVGVVKDTAIHDIDIARFIFDEDPVTVFAKAGNLRHEKFEDYIQIMLSFSAGKSAFLEANWLTPYKIRKLTVTGSEAIISLDYITQEMTIETLGETLTPRHEYEEPLKLELNHFVECIRNNETPLVTGLDGYKALKIAEAALKSAEKGQLIRLNY
jgi:UDP-N-acetylglucosamine 3-dehydrogenase